MIDCSAAVCGELHLFFKDPRSLPGLQHMPSSVTVSKALQEHLAANVAVPQIGNMELTADEFDVQF